MTYYTNSYNVVVKTTVPSVVRSLAKGNRYESIGKSGLTPVDEVNSAWISLLLPYFKRVEYLWIDVKNCLHFGFQISKCTGVHLLSVSDQFYVLRYNDKWKSYDLLGSASLVGGHTAALRLIKDSLGGYTRKVLRKKGR